MMGFSITPTYTELAACAGAVKVYQQKRALCATPTQPSLHDIKEPLYTKQTKPIPEFDYNHGAPTSKLQHVKAPSTFAPSVFATLTTAYPVAAASAASSSG